MNDRRHNRAQLLRDCVETRAHGSSLHCAGVDRHDARKRSHAKKQPASQTCSLVYGSGIVGELCKKLPSVTRGLKGQNLQTDHDCEREPSDVVRRSGTTPSHPCGVVLARERPVGDTRAFDEASFPHICATPQVGRGHRIADLRSCGGKVRRPKARASQKEIGLYTDFLAFRLGNRVEAQSTKHVGCARH
jgi:hypothetical protein